MSTLKDFSSIGPTFFADVSLKRSPKFSFVTISNPDEIKNPAKQSIIRRHAKRDADRERKKRHNEVQYESLRVKYRPFHQPAVFIPKIPGASRQEHAPVEQQTSRATPTLDFLRPLGAGRGFNPLAPYPVEPNSRSIRQLDYLWQTGNPDRHPMMDIWITIGMSDSSAFNITLASASLNFARKFNRVAAESAETMKYYSTAVIAVSKRLGDPIDSTSDGIVGAILGLACLDDNVGNWERWQVHMKGLQKIIQLRGGVGSLHSSYTLQMTTFWVDVIGSLVLDTPPHFPIPHYGPIDPEPYCSTRILTFFQKWNNQFPDLVDITEALTSLIGLANYVNNNTCQNRTGGMFVPLHVHPVAHELLSVRRYTIEAETNMRSSGLIIHEILRLTSLLFIGLIKEQYCVCSNGVSENKLRLARILTEVTVDWSSFMEIRLWVLTVSAITGEGDQSWHMSEIARAMTFLGLGAWDNAIGILKELIWIDGILDKGAETLGGELKNF